MTNGLTVPFALAAGRSGAVQRNYFPSVFGFSDSAHLQINSICSFEGISSGFDFLIDFGGIFPSVSSEQILEALFAFSAAVYSAHFDKFIFARANNLPLLP